MEIQMEIKENHEEKDTPKNTVVLSKKEFGIHFWSHGSEPDMDKPLFCNSQTKSSDKLTTYSLFIEGQPTHSPLQGEQTYDNSPEHLRKVYRENCPSHTDEEIDDMVDFSLNCGTADYIRKQIKKQRPEFTDEAVEAEVIARLNMSNAIKSFISNTSINI